MTILVEVLAFVVQIYTAIVLAAVILSWFPVSPWEKMGGIVRGLRKLTDPVFDAVRRRVPTTVGQFDLAPLLVLLALSVLRYLLLSLGRPV